MSTPSSRSSPDFLALAGRKALVIGGASGMGAEVVRLASALGAEATSLDIQPGPPEAARNLPVDLRDRAAIDRSLDQVEGPIDALVCCAGVAEGSDGLMRINFISQRYVIERLVERDALPRGAAIAMVSSVGGLGWQQQLPQLKAFLEQSTWDAATSWIDANPGADTYVFSKQAMNAYVASHALSLLQRGIRINAIEPGPTDTPLARANADVWLGFSAAYNKSAGVGPLTTAQMANVLIFLCSPASSGMTGVSFLVDQGQVNAMTTGSFQPSA